MKIKGQGKKIKKEGREKGENCITRGKKIIWWRNDRNAKIEINDNRI